MPMHELPICPQMYNSFKTHFPEALEILGGVLMTESLYLQHQIPLEQSVDEIASSIQKVQRRYIGIHQNNHREAANDEGYELIEIGTKMHKALEDFGEQKPLLAIPNMSFVCIVFDPKIGIAVSNKDLHVFEAVADFSRKILLSDELKKGWDVVSAFYGETPASASEIITPKIASEVLAESIDDAFDEFKKIYTSTKRPEEVTIFIRGYEAADKSQNIVITSSAQEYLMREFSLNRRVDSDRLSVNSILNVSIGDENGMIYGGPNHPRCSEPKDVFLG
ncbi:MAG: hypothetical protein PHQ59_05560 [Candidatus Daviesbacteria bacterium]|nr:hypothetical protein [Candidatus Daviesbacteria bacterium]